jgi:hypothetical protein
MKKSILLLLAFLFVILLATVYNCSKDTKESCQDDEICPTKDVTACCTGNVCVYKYNGKEYTEDQLDQLSKDLGCTSKTATLQSDYEVSDLKMVAQRLKALMDKVKQRTSSVK